ncbi:MAG: hypothetical protein IKN86_12525 [Bacteroidaceae bacterium]|nr:hypothetical protein [Bacteroidaceae bacterium]
MKKYFALLNTVVLTFVIHMPLQAQEIDPMSDTWVCNDGLGRVVASMDRGVTRKQVDENCQVGMFYYVWHGQHGAEVKDITRLLEADPVNPAWGSVNQFHWGGKPAMGYYTGGDRFIVAHHMQQLMDAGIDFYFFDVTNAFTYDAQVQVVMDEIDRRMKLGLKYPKLAFLLHSSSEKTSLHLYEKWYKNKPENDHYWFYWNGKPLMMMDYEARKTCDAAVRNHFTLRGSWAWEEGEDKWPWLAYYPQNYNFSNETGKKVYEQMTVATAMHPVSKIGKSYSGGSEPAVNKYGLTARTSRGAFFEEQFKQAIKMHPRVLMLTQWNEWMAQRFVTDESNKALTRPGATPKAGETYFVDVYNQEFNRDIEPSSESLIRDNYYMQLVSNVRKYRGAREIPVPEACKSIDLSGDFAQWDDVTPSFIDEPGDCEYTSSTAQKAESLKRRTNDIVLCKVAKDADSLYFYVQSTKHLIAPSISNAETWMTLLLNSDMNYSNGWEGYDYMISRSGTSDHYYIYTWNGETKKWDEGKEISWIKYANQMMLSMAKSDVALESDVDFDFKWIDNTPKNTTEILDFLCNGDVAPNARFNYRYKGSKLVSPESDALQHVDASGKRARVEVYNLSGVKMMTAVCSTSLKGLGQLCLPQGTYLAKFGNKSKKFTKK